MNRHRSASGRQVNWLSYRTEVKDVYLRMVVDHSVKLCFDIQPKDDGIRAILWEQMTEMKNVMESEMGVASFWEEDDHVSGKQVVSRICWEKQGLSFYQDENWEGIQVFLEEKLLAFDRFYQEYKDILINLAE